LERRFVIYTDFLSQMLLKNKKWGCILYCLCAIYGALFNHEKAIANTAPEFPIESLETAFKELDDAARLNGVVLIGVRDKIKFVRANGVKSVDPRHRLLQEDQFLLGSFTQQFTAVALLRALYKKHHSIFQSVGQVLSQIKADLHSPISKFLPPEHKIWNGKPPAWSHEVTLHHLLTHTSGTPDYTTAKAFYGISKLNKQKYYEQAHTTSELLELILKLPLAFKAGERYQYSNTNYLILSEVITAITGRDFGEYLEQLFQTLKMEKTHTLRNGRLSEVAALPCCSNLVTALHYDSTGRDKVLLLNPYAIDLSNTKGVANIISNADDLFKWNIHLHVKLNILPLSVYRLFTANYDSKQDSDGYGYATTVQITKYGELQGLQGRLGSYSSAVLYLPKSQTSIILLSNVVYNESKLKHLARKLWIQHKKRKNYTKARAIEETIERYPDIKGFGALWEVISNIR